MFHDPRPLRRCLTALPLLVLLGAAPGMAATVTVNGTPGTPGVDGTAGTPDGGPGGDGGPAEAIAGAVGQVNLAIAAGGAGGRGGDGAATGAAGAGGAGGDALAEAVIEGQLVLGETIASATGGAGGSAGTPGSAGAGAGGGSGGAASAIAGLTSGTLELFGGIIATGGDGGNGTGGADGGTGGAAFADATVTSSTAGGDPYENLSVFVSAYGGKGGASDSGMAGDGGEALAGLFADVSRPTSRMQAVARGGNASGATGGDAVAEVSLLLLDGGATDGFASASGGRGTAGGIAVALAESFGATGGSVKAEADAGDARGSVIVTAQSDAEGAGTSAAVASVGDLDLLFFGLDPILDITPEGANVHFGIAAPDGFAIPPEQFYGFGQISILSGGTGTPMTYAGAATYTFRAAATETLFLDFFADISPQFESLSFLASLNGVEVLNQTFDNAMSALDFFDRQHSLGFGRDGADSEFSMRYSFVANGPGQGLSTLYGISNIPVAPIPVPAALPLLLAALAGLAGLRLRASRAA